MGVIRSLDNSTIQKEYARAQWRGLLLIISEPFKGAFLVSFIFGFLMIPANGYLEAVFEEGIIEHAAIITLPLSLSLGVILAGIAALLRRKSKTLFSCFRSLANSSLILTISLFTVMSGLCFGLALPSVVASGSWWWLFIGGIGSVFFFGCALVVKWFNRCDHPS